jgi:uncharacterized protein (TIGR02271 family)
MLDQNRLNGVMGSTVYDSDGNRIGKVGEVYTDDQTGQPSWASVNIGLFGSNESFVPIRDASFTEDALTVPYSKDQVKDAPNVAADGHLSPEEESILYGHYGMSYSAQDQTVDSGTESAQGNDVSGPNTDDAMTRSEEQVQVGTRREEAGRARLRKYVVTENVTQTVPVRKEKAVLESEPVTDTNRGAATSGPDISEEEHEVTLHEERPVVEKTVEPVERVRLGTEEVQSEETVSEDVRKEQIDADGEYSDLR